MIFSANSASADAHIETWQNRPSARLANHLKPFVGQQVYLRFRAAPEYQEWVSVREDDPTDASNCPAWCAIAWPDYGRGCYRINLFVRLRAGAPGRVLWPRALDSSECGGIELEGGYFDLCRQGHCERFYFERQFRKRRTLAAHKARAR